MYTGREFIVLKNHENYKFIRTGFGPYLSPQPSPGYKFKIQGINTDTFASRENGQIYLRINFGTMITYKDLRNYLGIGVIEEFIEPHTIFKPIMSRLAGVE
jgi:hypothetical protein